MNRREFVGRLLGGVVAIPAAGGLLLACDGGGNGGGSSGEDSDGDCGTGAPANYTNPGHRHNERTLSAEDIVAAVPGSYRLLSGDHDHFLDLSAQDFVDLQAGMTVVLIVDEPFHQAHRIELRC